MGEGERVRGRQQYDPHNHNRKKHIMTGSMGGGRVLILWDLSILRCQHQKARATRERTRSIGKGQE